MDKNTLSDSEIMDLYADYLIEKLDEKNEKISRLIIEIDNFFKRLLEERYSKDDIQDAFILYSSAIVVSKINEIKRTLKIFDTDRCLNTHYY